MIRTTRRTLLLGARQPAFVAMPWVSRAQQLKAEYKLSVVGNRPIPLSEGAFQWAELVTQRTNGRINVKVYPGSQLVGGDQTRELVAMRQGIIDFTVSSTINLSPQIKEMTLYSMPFLMPNHKAFDALIGGEVGQDLFKVHGDARRGAARLGRERFSRAVQLEAHRAQAGRPQGHEDPLRGRADLRRRLQRARRQPAADELRRPAARALDRRGRRAGEPDQPVPRLQDGHAGAEASDHLELLRRRRHLPRREVGVGHVLQGGSGDHHRIRARKPASGRWRRRARASASTATPRRSKR